MNTAQEIANARNDIIQLLKIELKQIEKKMDDVDDVRTKLLRNVLELRIQHDGVIKQLDIMGCDTTELVF